MIKEIEKFIDTIPPDYQLEGLTLPEGLHILIEVEEDGNPLEESYKSFLVTKKESQISDNFNFALYKRTAELVDIQKPIDAKKKIHSAVPYVLTFKNMSTETKNKITAAGWAKLDGERRIVQFIKPYLENEIKDRLAPFYDHFLDNAATDNSERKIIEKIKRFAVNKMIQKLLSDNKLAETGRDAFIGIYFNFGIEKIDF